jgi:hypothetical protein
MLLSACKASKPATVVETVAVPEANSAGNVYRFIVSFYSIGTGVNSAAVQQLDEFVKKYETKNKVSIPYTPVRWGREGEVDYCFMLSGLSVAQQEAFIAETKALLKGAEHIHFKENETR